MLRVEVSQVDWVGHLVCDHQYHLTYCAYIRLLRLQIFCIIVKGAYSVSIIWASQIVKRTEWKNYPNGNDYKAQADILQ